MIKVLLHQNLIPTYRIPVFNKLAEYYDLTVVYTDECKLNEKINFKNIKVKKLKIPKIGYLGGKKLIDEIKKADVIIHMLLKGYPDLEHAKFFNRSVKRIVWGIGVSANYDVRYDSVDSGYYNVIKKADAAIFYSQYPKEKYVKMGIDEKKMFVANNTVYVGETNYNYDKKYILFIGSLYKQKRIDKLIDSYIEAYKENQNIPNLIIIGDGEEKNNIIKKVRENNLTEKIILTGEVFEEKVLVEFFSKAIFCISPDQAGLSVLKSMGYGVPFVTSKNAITGGEIFNIENEKTGILFENFSDIKNIILSCCTNRDKYIKMGLEAQRYYFANRTIDQMVKGFCDAIEYVGSLRQ